MYFINAYFDMIYCVFEVYYVLKYDEVCLLLCPHVLSSLNFYSKVCFVLLNKKFSEFLMPAVCFSCCLKNKKFKLFLIVKLFLVLGCVLNVWF